jgi:hypothetical protein
MADNAALQIDRVEKKVSLLIQSLVAVPFPGAYERKSLRDRATTSRSIPTHIGGVVQCVS